MSLRKSLQMKAENKNGALDLDALCFQIEQSDRYTIYDKPLSANISLDNFLPRIDSLRTGVKCLSGNLSI